MKKKIRFLVDASVEAQGLIVERFEAGKVYALEYPSAARWLRRKMAEDVPGATKVTGDQARTDQQPEAPKASADVPNRTNDDGTPRYS